MKSPAQRVKLLVSDVDGTLTDGRLYYDSNGVDGKAFNVLDGMGIQMLARAGIQVGLLSAKKSAVLEARSGDLDLAFCMAGVSDKVSQLDELLPALGLSYDEIGYIGDDLNDLPCLERSAFPATVADARPEVKRVAAYITRARGGDGAVRELAEVLLRAQGLWTDSLARYEP